MSKQKKKRPRRGRPPTGTYYPVLTVRIPPDVIAKLEHLAKEMEVSRSELIRDILTDFVRGPK